MPPRRSCRHRVHLFAYGFVSFCSIILGIVFTGYALFERRSVISKVWLAGPTTLAVGLVLCGKVIIDYKPSTQNDDDLETTTTVDLSFYEKQSMEMPIIKEYPDGFSMQNHFSHKTEFVSRSIQEKCDHKIYECDIWHLRDDSLLNYSSTCLNSSTYANEAYPDLDSSNLNLLQHKQFNINSTVPTVHVTKHLKSHDNPLIYHGETFLFNDRQYLI